jgi:hypothetical protein
VLENDFKPMATDRQFDRSRFDHVGVVTEDRQESESFVEATRVWVTSPRAHPYNVEFLRFEPDTPVTGPLRTEPHIAYRVDDIEAALRGHNVLLEPFHPAPDPNFLTVAFVQVGSAIVEFMEYGDPEEEGWF